MTSALLISPAGGLAQGDIVAAPLVRVTSSELFTPPRWDRFDEHHIPINDPHTDAGGHSVTGGRAILMVTSHDCHHDKEWNDAIRSHLKKGYSESKAEALASADVTLDRNFLASPLIPLEDFEKSKRGNIAAGRVVGFYPVPCNHPVLDGPAVVDLSYLVTIDRFAIERRIYALSESGRAQLRLCIARFDALRSVNLGAELEAAIGRRITDAIVQKGNPLEVHLTLDDGSTLRFLQQPAEPTPGGRRGI